MTHIEFEKKLMEMLLAGEDPVLHGLRHQFQRCTVTNRVFTGVGFYTDFSVDLEQVPVAQGRSFQLGDVDATLDGKPGTLGFVLFIRDGFLSFLEGYANTVDDWPEDYSMIELSYDSGKTRDIKKLASKWNEI